MTKVKVLLDSIEKIKEFIDILDTYDCFCEISDGEFVIDAKSIIGVFSLEFQSPLDLIIKSDDCGGLLDKIDKFIVR